MDDRPCPCQDFPDALSAFLLIQLHQTKSTLMEHSQEEFMRRIFAAAAMVALAGCTANTQVASTPAAAGTYNLIAVDGQAVPQVIGNGDEVVAGTLQLHVNGTFEMRTDMKTLMSSAQPLAYQRKQAGSYTSSQIGVQMYWQAGQEASGAFFGRTLRFYSKGVEYLYMK
jgi:hypothetical protein